MRVWLLLVAVLAGCRGSAAPVDDPVIADFRTTEQTVLQRHDSLVRQESAHLISEPELADRIQHELLPRWRGLRAQLDNAATPEGRREVYTLARHYLAERQTAWEEHAKALLAASASEAQPHDAAYRSHDASATADAQKLEAAFHALQLAPLPPLVPDAGIVLQPPPPAATGSAFLLVGHSVVLLDDAGFRTIATDVTSLDVLPDGTLWACSSWRLVRWDGARLTEWRPPVYSHVCAATPDGKVWLVSDDLDKKGADQLVSFDGKKWSRPIVASIGVASAATEQLLAAGDGTLYARTSEAEIVVFAKNAWQRVPLEKSPGHIQDMFRGTDGNVYVNYQYGKDEHTNPTAIARLTPTGAQPPIFIDGSFQQIWSSGSVDRTGLLTVLDYEHNTIRQGTHARQLPIGLSFVGLRLVPPGAFAYDAAGRIWIEAVDGLSVIAPDGTRTVYPRGSVDAVREPAAAIVVVGAGPKLPPPSAPVLGTFTGIATLDKEPLASTEIRGCGGPGGECDLSTAWTATTDSTGHFSLANVPRWTVRLYVRIPVAEPWWGALRATCCSGPTDLGTVEVSR